jgi:hypothetical protein
MFSFFTGIGYEVIDHLCRSKVDIEKGYFLGIIISSLD